MKDFEIKINVAVNTLENLPVEERALCEAALEATSRAYAPYSNFHVGAAILLSNGEVITGANQENAAFPSGTCAERSACFYAHARYPEAKFRVIAIAARNSSGQLTEPPTAPCGACRQALLEYETLAGAPVRVMLVGRDNVYTVPSVKSLLPLAFSEF